MEKINFENLPDTSTPINNTNLNQLQANVENEFSVLNNKINDVGNMFNDAFNNANTISANMNLNNLTTTGCYTNGGVTPANSPNGAVWSGILLVFKSYYTVQIIILSGMTGNGIWTRMKFENDWSTWHKHS